jgi:energy-converting hydrogenase Eha subunit A
MNQYSLLTTLGQALQFLLLIFMWIVSVTFAFAVPAVAAALVKKHLTNENRYRRKKFETWTRIILLTPPLSCYIFLNFARLIGEIVWISLLIVAIFTFAIIYYPDTASGLVDWTIVLLDRLVAIRGRLRRMSDGKE